MALNKEERESLLERIKIAEDELSLLKDAQRTDIELLAKQGVSVEDIATLYKMKPYATYMMLWAPVRDSRARIQFKQQEESFDY